MDNFISLGFGPDGMTAFVGLFLDDAAAGGDEPEHTAPVRCGGIMIFG